MSNHQSPNPNRESSPRLRASAPSAVDSLDAELAACTREHLSLLGQIDQITAKMDELHDDIGAIEECLEAGVDDELLDMEYTRVRAEANHLLARCRGLLHEQKQLIRRQEQLRRQIQHRGPQGATEEQS